MTPSRRRATGPVTLPLPAGVVGADRRRSKPRRGRRGWISLRPPLVVPTAGRSAVFRDAMARRRRRSVRREGAFSYRPVWTESMARSRRRSARRTAAIFRRDRMVRRAPTRGPGGATPTERGAVRRAGFRPFRSVRTARPGRPPEIVRPGDARRADDIVRRVRTGRPDATVRRPVAPRPVPALSDGINRTEERSRPGETD